MLVKVQPLSNRYKLFSVLDTLIIIFIIFPLNVLHWRGTWQLQDVYFAPQDDMLSAWISLAIGANVCLLELLIQPSLAEWLQPRPAALYTIVSRIHLYIHGWAVMCYWRGVWNLLDLYLTVHWLNAVISYVVCQLILILTKTVRTAVGVPMAVSVDTDPNLLEPDTVFKIPPQWTYAHSASELIRFVLDCCFSQFIVVSSSITVWRGIWNICDEFIFPHFRELSEVVSFVVGLVGISTFYAMQMPTSFISRRLDRYPRARLLFEDCIFLPLTWFTLLIWRGAWNLCEDYFLPNPRVGSWVSHVVGTVGLLALQAFNTVGLHGIVRDGSYTQGEGIYDTRYLRVLFPDFVNGKNGSTTDKSEVSNPQSAPLIPQSSDVSVEMSGTSSTLLIPSSSSSSSSSDNKSSSSHNKNDQADSLLNSTSFESDEGEESEMIRINS